MVGRKIETEIAGKTEIWTQQELEKYIKKSKPYDMQLDYYPEYDDDGEEIDDKTNWKDVPVDITKFAPKTFTEEICFPFENVQEYIRMKDGNEAYLNAYSELDFLAYSYHNANKFHPFAYRFDNFNVDKFVTNLFKHVEVPAGCYVKSTFQNSSEAKLSAIFIAFAKDLWLFIDGPNKGVIFYNPNEEKDNNKLMNSYEDNFFEIIDEIENKEIFY
jgi:hypothetical protein